MLKPTECSEQRIRIMRIGLFTAAQWEPKENPETVLKNLTRQVQVAEDNGFTSLLLGQHLLSSPICMFQTIPLLATLSQLTNRMQLGPGVLLLSMLNPILTAEESATIDWLSDGRFVLAAGLGYRPEEFQAMGVNVKDRVGRFAEGIEIVKRLWTEDRITHAGSHFQLTNVGASVRPKQNPRPPIWIGGDVESAVRRAARIGDAWLASPTCDLDTLSTHMEAFRAERRKHQLPETVACPIIRECFVGRTVTEAQSISRGPLLYKYRAYASWGHEDTSGGISDNEFDNFAANRFIIGDHSKVSDALTACQELTGTNHIVARVQWPGLEHSDVIANIERLGHIAAHLP